jgi:lipopolysaccharide export system protein LptA
MIKNNTIYIIIIFLFSFVLLNAEENYLNIDATVFEANEKEQLLYFKGDVKMTKNKDILKCQSLIINTTPSKNNSNKQIPKDYTATGDVSFVINTIDNVLKGKGDTVYYNPKEQKYIITGNGYLEDTKDGKILIGDKIYIDEKTGNAQIEGKKNKPVKFTFKIKTKDTSETN